MTQTHFIHTQLQLGDNKHRLILISRFNGASREETKPLKRLGKFLLTLATQPKLGVNEKAAAFPLGEFVSFVYIIGL
jgi:hypothetical protein